MQQPDAALVTLYVTDRCGYCRRAERLLDARGIAFDAIDVSGDGPERRALVERTRWRTVPVIFLGEELVGGYEELAALERSGELARRLAVLRARASG